MNQSIIVSTLCFNPNRWKNEYEKLKQKVSPNRYIFD